MNTKKYNWILYVITSTILITIAVQLYWNYNNYLNNKQRIRNEIQNSLDIAIDEYYTDLSKSNFFAVFNSDNFYRDKKLFKKFLSQKKDSVKNKFRISSIEFKTDNQKSYIDVPSVLDSLISKDHLSKTNSHHQLPNSDKSLNLIQEKIQTDSLKVLKGIQSVVIAMTNDIIDFKLLDSIFDNQLSKKEIKTLHSLVLLENDTIIRKSEGSIEHNSKLYASSKSTYLRENQNLRAYYEDPNFIALKKSSLGIFLSFLIALAVISSLFYMLKIIRTQKELAEIKNDLISNITHEFKTPIATISTAIEAIESFNVIEDKDKTQKYLSMSTIQLKKLHQMVEKLLETATLDSENLLLKKEALDIIDLVKKTSVKYQHLTKKQIIFSSNLDAKLLNIDSFHFENSISNLIDNAIKYGGDTIEININVVLNFVEIIVADNGNGIEINQQEKIFDKFYRIPKGNRHDVKGFGIGLYYTRKIVEKHQGTIQINSNSNNTIFKISLPNE